MKTLFSLSLYLAVLAIPHYLAAQVPIERSLRLNPGNYWVYKGTVAWSCPVASHPDRVCRKEIFWKSEIVEEQTRPNLKAYLVHGSFDDLSWYVPGKQPDHYLWLVYGNRFYTLRADQDMIRRFHDSTDTLLSLIEKEQPTLQFPLQTGQCTQELKPEEPRQRKDLLYCWHFEKQNAGPVKFASSKSQKRSVWSAIYQTMPDEEVLKFASGVGFTSFDYSHHGTAAEAHVQLAHAHLR
ncbi:MAG TPA: hypothetical protein VJV96_02410 [Candidatus Angelobacter sp.]|nr:hypothetical protein [Candidatus Angelobacter sp.]